MCAAFWKRTSYRFLIDLCLSLFQLETTSGTKSKVLESTEGRQMRGFTQTQLPSRDNRAKFGVSAVSREGASVAVDLDVLEAVASVRNDATPLSWVLAGKNTSCHCQRLCGTATGGGGGWDVGLESKKIKGKKGLT
jgi:hypothetical protein